VLTKQELPGWLKNNSEWILSKYLNSFTPVLISRHARKNYRQEKPIETHPFMAHGSGTFVCYKNQRWLITALHVIDTLRAQYGCAPIYILNGLRPVELHPDRDNLLLYSHREYDLALIPLSESNQPNLRDATFIPINESQLDDTEEHFRIGLCGYLRKTHKSISDRMTPSFSWARITHREHASKQNRLILDYDRTEFEGSNKEGDTIPQPDGLSGGPAFASGDPRIRKLESDWKLNFKGILLEQHDRKSNSTAEVLPLDGIIHSLSSLPNGTE